MGRSRKISAAIDAVGLALSSEHFRRRFAAAGRDADSLTVVEAMARDELKLNKVDLEGLRAVFGWEPAKRKLTVTIEPDHW